MSSGWAGQDASEHCNGGHVCATHRDMCGNCFVCGAAPARTADEGCSVEGMVGKLVEMGNLRDGNGDEVVGVLIECSKADLQSCDLRMYGHVRISNNTPHRSAFPWRTIDTAPIDTVSDCLFAMIVWGAEDDQSIGCGMRYKGEWYAGATVFSGGPGTQRQYEFRDRKVSPTHWAPRLPLPNKELSE